MLGTQPSLFRQCWASLSDGDLLDELSHVLTQCFTAGPLALSVAVERVGAGMLLMTVERDFHEIKH